MNQSIHRPRAREMGIPFGSFSTGPLNAITDVAGVKVGHQTLIEGDGELVPGKGPIRTGVTVILPHSGDICVEQVPGAVEWFNGYGECLGAAVVNEFGAILGPIALTNSYNVYRVGDALQEWFFDTHPEFGVIDAGPIPLVAECADDYLNDARGRHVSREQVCQALTCAAEGLPAEGSVGGGTGDIAFGFKGGIGTSSRVLPSTLGGYTVGALVQTNFGSRRQLLIAGVPVGRIIAENRLPPPALTHEGSCVLVIATDAPLSSRQVHRIARRAFLGQARTGGTARNGSGDVAIAFSTANRHLIHPPTPVLNGGLLPDFRDEVTDALFQAVTDAVEEAVINSIFASDTMEGRDGHIVHGLPLDQVAAILRQHGYPAVINPQNADADGSNLMSGRSGF